MNQENTDNNAGGLSGVLPAGAKLGKYEIVERLGSGGQSIVYKGYDPLLDRYVAIKQVAPQLAAEDKFTKRFRDVAKQLASLGCEQVVTLYELMEEDGGLFVVMEFVEGHTIETTLKDHPEPIDPKAVLQIIWHIAAGLTAIHKARIVHRDIKPGNIIIGDGLKVTITDFGVAAKAGAAVSMKLGTTKYMAPELFTGGEADGRSDIYSLGMIAYEMLLGREKFDEVFHDVVRDPHSEALRWMKWHSSPDQVAAPLAEINPDVPKALSVTVAKMLAKDPDERFANIEELGKEIRANFSPRAHRPRKHRGKKRHATETKNAVHETTDDKEITPTVDTSGPITAEIPKEPMSLRKKLAIIGMVVGIVIVGLLVYLGIDSSHQGKIREQALTDYRAAEKLYKEAAKTESSAEKRTGYTAAAEAFVAIHKNKQYARQVIKKKSEVNECLCRAHLAALDGDWETAYSHVKSAGELTKQLERKRGDLVVKWAQKIEQELRNIDADLASRREYARALDRAKKAISDGNLEQALKELDDAKKRAVSNEQGDEVRAIRRDIDEKQKQSEYWLHIRRGDGLASDGDVEGAIAEWNKALSVLESAKGTLTPKMYSELKQTAEKKKTVLTIETNYAAAMTEATKAEEDKNLLVAADAYEKANKIKPDEALLTKARDMRHDHHLQLGRQHLAANKLKDAERELKKAQSYKKSSDVKTELKKIINVKDYRTLLWQGNRAFRQKKYKVALEKYEAAGKLSSDAELQSKIKDCNYQIKLAEAETHRAKSEWVKAEVAYNKARQIKSSASAEIDARLELLRQDRTYAEQLAAAKQALEGKHLKEALSRANSAKNVRATPEVEEIIKRIHYEQQVALGKEAMGREDYNTATAYFKQAKRFISTPEIDKLIEQAEKLKTASPDDS